MSVFRFGTKVPEGSASTPAGASASTSTQHQAETRDHTNTSLPISRQHFRELYQLLLGSTTEERLAMPGMEPVRVEMIVPASIFINFVYNRYHLKSMFQSRYALKEGVMSRIVAAT
jgi:exopolyphosphatase/guanosine-5'-triphosphate,3'-diphosphate pyrophosphatase